MLLFPWPILWNSRADYAGLPQESATPFSLQSWRNSLYRGGRRLPAKPLNQLHQLDQILNPPYGSPRSQLHHRIFRHNVGPTGRNRDQMFTFLLEVDSILAPRMQISDEIELLAGPRMKGMDDLETSAQFVRISRS